MRYRFALLVSALTFKNFRPYLFLPETTAEVSSNYEKVPRQYQSESPWGCRRTEASWTGELALVYKVSGYAATVKNEGSARHRARPILFDCARVFGKQLW